MINAAESPIDLGFPALLVRRQPLSDYWQVERLDQNALTLDYCQYWLPAVPVGLEGSTIGGFRIDLDRATGWSSRVPVWKADEAIRSAFGRGQTAGNWFNVAPGIEQPFAVRYTFVVDPSLVAQMGRLALVVETPERYKITVNGARVPAPADGWWIDPAWRPIDIAGLVRPGENTIQIEGTYFHDTELESCYVIGDFAVETLQGPDGPEAFRLVPETARVRHGAGLERQGLPFYAGRLRLTQTVNVDEPDTPVYLDLGQVDATVAEVRVNGQPASTLAWHPWWVEVTGRLQPGPNEVELTLYNSLHNLLGHHHDRRGELHSISPRSFTDELNWTDRYFFVPLGVAGVQLVFCS